MSADSDLKNGRENIEGKHWSLIVMAVMITLCVFLAVLVGIKFWIKYHYTAVAISGKSMYPTLDDGDVIYLDTTLGVKRGDVVVIDVRPYKERDGLTTDYIIKRVICLEGDEIECRCGDYYVNYGGTGWQILNDDYAVGEGKNDFVRTVGEGEIFFLGDNYEVSKDSSSHEMGTYYAADIVGVVPKWAIEHKDLIRGWENCTTIFGSSDRMNI